MNNDCDALDAYLDDDLSAGEAARFRVHLGGCEACREAITQQGWIDSLLQSPERIQLETPATGLTYSIRSSLYVRPRNSRLIAGGLAVAAALMLAVGWAVLNLKARSDGTHRSGNVALNHSAEVPAQPALHRAVVVGGPEMIVVPVVSRHPDVTVVRVFPTYQPEIYDHFSTEQQPATDDFVWPDDFNGGT